MRTWNYLTREIQATAAKPRESMLCPYVRELLETARQRKTTQSLALRPGREEG
jgi:preprotein translocase subunit SecB